MRICKKVVCDGVLYRESAGVLKEEEQHEMSGCRTEFLSTDATW